MIQINANEYHEKAGDKISRAGNLCTREYSALQFFGFGAGFISDHICIEGKQCIQFIGGLKLKPCYKYSRVLASKQVPSSTVYTVLLKQPPNCKHS